MKILNQNLLDKIEDAKNRLDKSKVPNMIGEVFKTMEEQVMENAPIQDRDNEERKIEVIENFKKAWNYADKNLGSNLNYQTLKEIAGRVEPILKSPQGNYAKFREGGARFSNIHYAPIDRFRIETQLDRLSQSIEVGEFHPLEESILKYFHLIRIQPFTNGNKRTANIIMNVGLKKLEFLPITIPQGESILFQDYLFGAIEGFKESGSETSEKLSPFLNPEQKQLQFYDYLARRELSALRCAEDKMAGLQHYMINFESKSPNASYGLKHRLSGYLRGKNIPGQVKLNVRENNLEVIGEIPFNALEKIITESKGIKKININLIS